MLPRSPHRCVRNTLLLDTKPSSLFPAPQVDVLEAQVGELESAVAQLDSYSKRLEMKFSALHLQMG